MAAIIKVANERKQESTELNKCNLTTNVKKSAMIKYSRTHQTKEDFKNENHIKMNGSDFIWDHVHINSNIVKFLGFKLNFNLLNFLSYHLSQKLTTFNALRNNLYYNKLIGDDMPIIIQRKFYASKLRMAFIYGLKIIKLSTTNLTQIDSMQHKYLTTIMGTGVHTNDNDLRMVLGVPKLSNFIRKLKLIMSSDS
eukprot:445614_1